MNEEEIVVCASCGHKSVFTDRDSYLSESHSCHEVMTQKIKQLQNENNWEAEAAAQKVTELTKNLREQHQNQLDLLEQRTELEKKLAAAQASIQKYKEYVLVTYGNSIDLYSDTSALDTLLASAKQEEWERCAKVCESVLKDRLSDGNHIGYNAISICAEAIRSLK
jgi:chromosome segregation ATPase